MFEMLSRIYTRKEISLSDIEGGAPFVLNRMLSMNPNIIDKVEEVNRFTFRCRPEIVKALMWAVVPKHAKMPFYKYMKKIDEKASEWSFLLDRIVNYYNWSEKDLKINIPILLKFFENKDILRNYFRFFGIDKKYYKKYDIPLKKEKRWF